jgi:hypothetical protein
MLIQFEGSQVLCEDETVYCTDLRPGELYLAKNRNGWQLLTCAKVFYGANLCDSDQLFCKHYPEKGHPSFLIPEENKGYTFDAWRAYRVLQIG